MKHRPFRAVLASAAVCLLAIPAAVRAATDQPSTAAPAAAAASGKSVPDAVVPEAVYDAGTVPPAKKVEHSFAIRNEGSAPLEITDVRPACGCTVAQFDRTIAPGATGYVHTTLDTTSFHGSTAKSVTVLTNDAAKPTLELTIKVDVEPNIFVEPGFARFIQPQFSNPGVVRERIWTRDFDDLQISSVQSPAPYLDAALHRIEDPANLNDNGKGPQYELVLTFDYDKAPIGPLSDYVVLQTNHPRQSVLKIPVSGFVRPLVAVTPDHADFGQVSVGEEGYSGSLTVKYYGQESFEIRRASSSVPGVEVSVEPGSADNVYILRVKLAPDMPKGRFTGSIKLETNLITVPSVEVPLDGTVS